MIGGAPFLNEVNLNTKININIFIFILIIHVVSLQSVISLLPNPVWWVTALRMFSFLT